MRKHKQFAMSMYISKESLFKDKSDYYQTLSAKYESAMETFIEDYERGDTDVITLASNVNNFKMLLGQTNLITVRDL